MSDDDGLIALIRRLGVESERFTDLFVEFHGVHRTDMTALVVIMDAARAGAPMTPTALAAALNLSNSATTSVLDRLEQAGHIERTRSAQDRRRIELRMHERARELGAAFFAPLRAELVDAWQGMTDADRAVVARFLRTTIEATVAARERLQRR
ncbi:MarR family winged helix-turn-helix transcriptional regulator [Actinokineospora sp. NPDC004072]